MWMHPKPGPSIEASLDDPIMVGGAVVIPKGADAMLQAVKVEQSGKMKGSDLIQLESYQCLGKGEGLPCRDQRCRNQGQV